MRKRIHPTLVLSITLITAFTFFLSVRLNAALPVPAACKIQQTHQTFAVHSGGTGRPYPLFLQDMEKHLPEKRM
jgi:hypothetical protein